MFGRTEQLLASNRSVFGDEADALLLSGGQRDLELTANAANTVGTAHNRRHSSQDKKKGKRDDRPVLSRCGFHSDDCVSIRPPGLRGRQPGAETSCLPKPAQGQRFELAT